MEGKLKTTPQAADALGVSRRTLETWRFTGTGPTFVKVGRAVRYRPEDLEAFLRPARSTSEVSARRAS